MSYRILLNEHSSTPKYQQIAQSVVAGIKEGELHPGDQLPSVNSLIVKHGISRDTVVKGYDLLKEQGVIESVPGKGYFVPNPLEGNELRIFLAFNKLSQHKKTIYDAFVETIGNQGAIDFHVYRNDFKLLKKQLESHPFDQYSHFVLIPHFLEGEKEAREWINQLPKRKLILLDKKMEGIHGPYASVYQEFEEDIYHALAEALPLLKKYRSMTLLFPEKSYHPKEIAQGFERFCQKFGFHYDLAPNTQAAAIRKGNAYISLTEEDLVGLIRGLKANGWRAGKDIGLLSYNDTPVKDVLLDGITVISTAFEHLGRQAARFVLDNRRAHIANPFRLIVRKSL
ncbi:MAG: GntR family transcriptional regulator [Haliscomenobacter sp.]|nr:GntR family transcriptional regulator [Haliscomenobacter sp.]